MEVGELVVVTEQKKAWFEEDYPYPESAKILKYYLQRHKVARVEGDRLYIKFPKKFASIYGREWSLRRHEVNPVRKKAKPCHCGWAGCKNKNRRKSVKK